MQRPTEVLSGLFSSVSMDNVDIAELASMVRGDNKPKWPRYADDAWFSEYESRCEARLTRFFASVS